MLTIEDYIAKRKQEDKLNEFSKEERMENTRTCIGYVFEYFHDYFDVSAIDEVLALEDEKLNKYRYTLREYSEEIQEWLANIYKEYGRSMNYSFSKFIKRDINFPIYSTNEEFRALAYEYYGENIKKFPFFRNQVEMIFKFMKEYFDIHCGVRTYYFENIIICDEITQWIRDSWSNYHVNVYRFAADYVYDFSEDQSLWPIKYKIRKGNEVYYDYKQKKNLFNVDSLYKSLQSKPFIKGYKQELEVVLMYHWLNSVDDDGSYWDEYAEVTLPYLSKKRKIITVEEEI